MKKDPERSEECLKLLKKAKEAFKKNGYSLHCGVADVGGKKANAGIALAVGPNVKAFKEPFKNATLKKVEDEGRLVRYVVDLGWDESIAIYNIYIYIYIYIW